MATDLIGRDERAGDELARVSSRRRRAVAGVLLAAAVVAAAAVSAAVFGGDANGAGRPVREGAAPPFDLARVGLPGERVSLTDFAGKPLVVNFWASWCVPCRTEMPALEAVAERLAGRVAFVGVNFQDSDGPAADFERERGVTYPSGADPDGAVGRAYGVAGLPTTVVVDSSGQIVARRLGKVTEAQLLALLEEASILRTTVTDG